MTAISEAVAANRTVLKQVHDGNPYYLAAEQWIDTFWHPESVFVPLFAQLDLTNCVELACGHGRHAAQVVDRAGQMVLVDINESNLVACRERFAGRRNVEYYLTAGNELSELASQRHTSLFCYDAMVHFEAADAIAYLDEICRILRPGGKALLHFSNYDAAPENTFDANPHWRNFFSARMMRHFATRAGLTIDACHVIAWPPPSGAPDLDGVVLLRKE